MPREKTTMRKIREILRLRWQQSRSLREVAASCGVGYGTVVELLRRASAAGLSWDAVEAREDDALEAELYPPLRRIEEPQAPDFSWVYLEMKKKGVTLRLLWEEYRVQNPDGYGYSWFCDEYRSFARDQDVVFRHHYKTGEQMQVDWAGQTVPIRDRETGEERPAYIFVACLCASQLIYCEACPSQKVEDWVGAHVRALEYFGGVPEIVVAESALAMYYELLDLIPYARKGAEVTEAGLLTSWERSAR